MARKDSEHQKKSMSMVYGLAGGTFAIHDLMSPARYGDMNAFVRKLKAEGYFRRAMLRPSEKTEQSSPEENASESLLPVHF